MFPQKSVGEMWFSVLIPELHHCCVIDLLLLELAPIAPTARFSIHPFISDEERYLPLDFSLFFVNTIPDLSYSSSRIHSESI